MTAPLADWQRCWAWLGTKQCQRRALPLDTRCAECREREGE